jgi:hypothetical protein
MKLQLSKAWFQENLPQDNPEVGIGVPLQDDQHSIPGEPDALSDASLRTLIQLLRMDQTPPVEQLAATLSVGTPELITIFDLPLKERTAIAEVVECLASRSPIR